MASSSTVRLFLDTVTLKPIIIDCPRRFATFNPKDFGGSGHSKVFAIISSAHGDIHSPIHDGVTIGDDFHFILDSSFSSSFLLKRNNGSSSEGDQNKTSHTKDDIVCLSDSSNEESPKHVSLSSDNEDDSKKVDPHVDSDVEGDSSTPVNVDCSEEMQLQESTLQSIMISSREFQKLSKIVQSCSISQVEEVPQEYDGNCLFELPPIQQGSSMAGMEQQYDGHCWVKPVLTRMKFPANIRRSKCGGHLICSNETCPIRAINGRPNQTSWTGKLLHAIPAKGISSLPYGSLVCFHCGVAPILLKECPCVVYYVLPNENRTRLFIHQGTHTHLVAKGVLRLAIQKTRELVSQVVSNVPTTGPRHLQLNIAKQMVMGAVIREDGSELHSNELMSILEEMRPLVHTHRFKHMMKEASATKFGIGIESQILKLKASCGYRFFHGILFPGQSSDPEKRCHVFKMSTTGPGSGIELVNRMRQDGNGDLRKSWVCFDHVRRVVGWTTMAAHVYDPTVQEMQTIAICEMKEEDTNAQIMFWEMINEVMLNNGHPPADFRGFMADEAAANWRAVRSVFNGGPDNVMEGRERSCLFHWEQSLHIHTSQYVNKNFQDEHKKLCENWRCARNEEDALNMYRRIRAWWATGKVSDVNIPQMDCWLSWWHVRYPRWKKHFTKEIVDMHYVPTTNLAETKHASWLAGEGNKQMISLYDASVSDLANALLQSVKMLAFVDGRYHGAGPSAEKLARRVAQGYAPTPTSLAKEVQQSIGGTSIYQQANIEGDNITVTKKRKKQGTVIVEEENASHRPEYLTQNATRRKKNSASIEDSDLLQGEEDMVVAETEIHKTMWAIRRIPQGSRVQCQGWLGGQQGKCKSNIKNTGIGTVAPSFWGFRTWDNGNDGGHGRGSKAQYMWFCNNSVDHTWKVCNTITQCPARVPTTWPVQSGTNLTKSEFKMLEQAGFTIEKQKVKATQNVRYRSGVSEAAARRIASAISMEASIVRHDIIKQKEHEKFQVSTANSELTKDVYEVHIATNPFCTCRDFADRAAQGRPYLACKHIYFVFLRVFGLDVNHNMFIHQCKLQDDDLARVFNTRRSM